MICDSCEDKNLAPGETHTEMHTVVRITEEERKRSTEERLRLLEDKLAKTEETLQNRLAKAEETLQNRLGKAEETLQNRVTKAEETLQERLVKIEEMLAKLVEKGTDGSRSDILTRGDPHAATTI